jgi:hypothetical protein
MPSLQKLFWVEVTPERFVDNCSEAELRETELLVEARLNRLFRSGGLKELKAELPLHAATIPEPDSIAEPEPTEPEPSVEPVPDSTPESRPESQGSPKSYKRWTDYEKGLLIRMSDSGMDDEAIAGKLSRSRAAVQLMRSKMQTGVKARSVKDDEGDDEGDPTEKKKYIGRSRGRPHQLYEDKFIKGAY